MSNGCRRRTVIKPGGYICIRKVGFQPIQVAPQRFSNVFVLFLIGDKDFFIYGGNFYETMANFEIIFDKNFILKGINYYVYVL